MTNVSHLAIVIGSLQMGGAEKAAVHLANEFERRGIRVDMVMVNAKGEFISHLEPGVRVIDLKARHTRRAGKPFRNYILKEQPEIVIAIQSHVQLMVLMTRHKHRFTFPVILNEQSIFSSNVPARGLKNILIRILAKKYFPLADAVAAVSTATAKDFTVCFPELNGRVDVIYNPVLPSVLTKETISVPDHPFFQTQEIPLIMSAGRLNPSKDFNTLLKAVSIVRKQIPVHLMILGEGEERENLLRQAKELQITESFSLPGFIPNPMSWMNYASVFVLSSKYEGLPFVLVEAMSVGCPVISTDCPGGSSEILGNGTYGRMVPVGDPERMAEAIVFTLKNRINKSILQKRASDFSAGSVVNNYLELIDKIRKGNE